MMTSARMTSPSAMLGFRRACQARPRRLGLCKARAVAATVSAMENASIANTWVDDHVDEVDREVHKNIGYGEDQEHGLDHGIVALQDRVDHQPAEPRDG